MAATHGPPVVVLGAGLTGLSTALHLAETPGPTPSAKRDPPARAGSPGVLVVEREQRVGGKARSERRDGYTFDVTGHWLHLRHERVRALVDRLLPAGDLVEIERRTGIYTHGVMLAYPFQANLFGLPLPVVQQCLVGFLQAQVQAASPDAPAPRTFEEFAIARFGEGIARHFFVPYNSKLWGEHYHRLTPDWVSRFVPIPDVEQVIGGAIGLRQEGLGYNARFLYPRRGGIDVLPEAMAAAIEADGEVELRRGVAVEEVDPGRSRVKLSDRPDWLEYRRLVSTLPLPELVDRIPSAPADVRDARAALRWVRWRWLDVATRSPVPMAEHWVYVPAPEIPFFRVGVYSNALPAMAPAGAASLYVELADRQRPPDVPAICRALAEMGALASADDARFVEQRDVEYAYVVFDEAHPAATATIHRWLEEVGIRSCGRYGAWIYNSMEDCIVAGMEAAAWARA